MKETISFLENINRFPRLTSRHCLYWALNLISKELRPTTAIIRFLFCVKVGRLRTSCFFFHKTGSKLKEEGQSWFCCYTISPYGIKKKTTYRLAHFPLYYYYRGPFFLTITTRFCDKRNCFVTRYTSFIWCHKVPPLSSSPPERLLVNPRRSPEMQERSGAKEEWNCKLFFSLLLIF